MSISRVSNRHTYPANFMLVAAMNPCPCGYHPGNRCRCTDFEVIKYRNKISGPIMDRIDIQKMVHPVEYFKQLTGVHSPSSAKLREIVVKARKIQQERYKDHEGINCNAQMTTSLIKQYCQLDDKSLNLLKATCERNNFSARVIHKLLRLARTSADMVGSEMIRFQDVEYVLSLRDLDKSNNEMCIVTSNWKTQVTEEVD